MADVVVAMHGVWHTARHSGIAGELGGGHHVSGRKAWVRAPDHRRCAPGLRSTKREWVGSRAAAPRAQCSERPLDTEHPGQRALRTPLNRTPHTVRDGGGAWAQRQPMGLGADQSTT